MSASTGDNDASNQSAAVPARLIRSLVDTVLQLKEAPDTLGIDIVGDRRAAEPYCVGQDFSKRHSKLFQFRSSQAPCAPSRPDACMKETLVGVDVSYPGKEGLIQQCCLNCQLPSVEELCKLLRADGERFRSGTFESRGSREITKLEATEAPGVDKSQFLSAVERQPSVGVRCERSFRSRHQQTPRHSEMDDPLCADSSLFRARPVHNRAARSRSQFADNVLAGAMDFENPASCQGLRLASSSRLEWFAMPAEPDIHNPIAAHTRIRTPGDRFHLRKFRHLPILEEHYLLWSSGSRMRFASKLTIRQDFLASWT